MPERTIPSKGCHPPPMLAHADGALFNFPQVQLSSFIGIHSTLLRRRRRSMGRFTLGVVVTEFCRPA
jgi:hypothetical protein